MTDSLSLTNNNDDDSPVQSAGLSAAAELMNDVTAEALLANTPALEQVLALRDKLSIASDGTLIGYDDACYRIKVEVDDLPTLELQNAITPGTEGAYQRQLLHALEKINDDHDRVLHKLVKLKSRLLSALDMIQKQKVNFTAYFSLAFSGYVNALPKLKRPKYTVKQIEAMSEGDYARLMNYLERDLTSMVSELVVQEDIIKTRKKTQAAKYQLGKDQVSTLWTSFQSHGAIGLDDDPNALLKKFPVEEEDEIPSFVSKHTKEVRVAASSSLVVPPTQLCSVCGEKQFETPSGTTCINGHGGAPSVSEASTANIKGTFVKRGDPQPITPIVNDGGELTEPLASEPEGKELFIPAKKVLVVPPQVGPSEIAKLRADIDACVCGGGETIVVDYDVKWIDPEIADDKAKVEPEPVEVKEYRPKFNLDEVVDTMLTPTKRLEIEDIADYPTENKPTLAEALDTAGFKPVHVKRIVLPEGATPVEDIEGILNDPPALATAATTTPRRKLLLLDEDEL